MTSASFITLINLVFINLYKNKTDSFLDSKDTCIGNSLLSE